MVNKKEEREKELKNRKLTISLSGRTIYIIFLIMIFLIGIGLTYAYNSGLAPSVMGHSFDEIEMPACFDGQVIQKIGSGWGCGTVSGGGSLECVVVRTNEGGGASIVSSTASSSVPVNDVVQVISGASTAAGSSGTSYGLRCKDENGWSVTGCAHSTDTSDNDNSMEGNGCYGGNNDGTSFNTVDVSCCRTA